jgi:hypothetical protein
LCGAGWYNHPGWPAHRPGPVRDGAGAPIDEAARLAFVRGRFGEVEDHPPVIAAATARIGTALGRLAASPIAE